MKKICVVVASRANYARVKYLMKAIKSHPKLELVLILGASALLDRYGNIEEIVKKDGFKINKLIHYVVEGKNLSAQAKSTGLGMIELATSFQELQPDAVITVADRYETMATAITATYLNIPLIHIQGGEVSGNIDNRVRNGISKLADIHFPCTEASLKRLISLGEKEEFIFNFGCPSIDILTNEDLVINNSTILDSLGSGIEIDWSKPYILMLQHPVTTSYGHGFDQVTETLKALKSISSIQKIVMWPNVDAGSDEVAKGIRHFREFNSNEPMHFYTNLTPENYAKVLNNASCCVGNSSSFIREGAFLGVPAVIIGDRQVGREHGENVIFSDYNSEEIVKKIYKQFEQNRYKSDKLFGDGLAGKNIANKISEIELTQKFK